ncbi:hypothetical protein Tco_0496425 [Tanacetum coccineum]
MYSLTWQLACQYELATDMSVRGGKVRAATAGTNERPNAPTIDSRWNNLNRHDSRQSIPLEYMHRGPAIKYVTIVTTFSRLTLAYFPSVPLYTGGVLEKDPAPHLTTRQEQTVKLLKSHKAPFRRYPKCFLCLVGLSPYYPFDDNSYPAFERPDGTDMGLLDFIKTADPQKVRVKVRVVEVQKGDDQVILLESTRHCFMPLVIPAAGGSSSVASTEIPAPTERGQEGVAKENAYLELADPDEGTAMVRQSDEELRTDHPSLASGTGGKTLVGLEQIMPAGSRLLAREQSATPSVAPPSQESKGFVDFSAQASLQIRTTVGSSSTLSAPIDTAAATTTSTKAKLAADVNPDLAGPSQLEESEGSDDSFYELATLDPSEAKRWYVPRWNITNDSLLDDGFSCRTLVDRVAPPAFFSALRSMDCDQLYTEFNVGAARQICLGSEVRSRAEHELELKEKLNAKYAAREAAEVVHLRDQVSSLSEEKATLTAEVSALKVTLTQKDHDISLLDSRATHLESALNDAQVAYTEARTKITSLASEHDRLASEVSSLRASFKDFKEKMEIQQEEQAQELYKRVAELEAYVMDGILGHALGWDVDFGMQEGLEVGHEHGVARRSLFVVDAYNQEVASADYVNAVKALEDAHFPLVDLLKSKKDAGMDEVLDCFLLDGPLAELSEAASLQPCIEQLSIPIHHASDKTAVGETSLSFALMNVHARAEGAKKHAAALRQLMMEIVSAPLSSQTWVGEASISTAPLSLRNIIAEEWSTFLNFSHLRPLIIGADDEEISEGGIPRVIVLGYDGLPMQPVAPPSPDYIPGLEDLQTPPIPQDEDEREPMFIQAHDPDYVPEPIYPEYIPLDDEHEFPAEEQPLPPVDSPTDESPEYVTESDPEEDPEEYEDDETEDGPVDYPIDGGDDGDDDDGDSSRDDANDEDEEED